MEMKDKIVDKLKRGALSCGSFTTSYAVVTMLFFVPYVNSYGGAVVSAFLPIAFLVPFIIMPIAYSVMHRFSPLLFGRYHLFMPISAVIAALFFVTAFSATEKNAIGAASMFFGMRRVVSALLIYRYCTFSVAARLAGDNVGKQHISSYVIAIVGAVCGVCTMYGFYSYNPETMYANCALVLAAASIIIAFIGYLASFNDVPVLGGKHVQSIKSGFIKFYGGINRRAYFSSFAPTAAFFVVASLSVAHTSAILKPNVAFAVAFVTVGVFACAYAAAKKFIKRRSTAVAAAIALTFVLSATLFGVSIVSEHAALVVIAAGLCGAGGALALRCMCLEFLSIKPRVTSGVVFTLLSLTVCAAFAVALAVAAVAINVPYAFDYGFGIGGLAAPVGLLLSVQKLFQPKKAKTDGADTASRADDGEDNITDKENQSEKENV